MEIINPRRLPTSVAYDPMIHPDYCNLGHPQYTQIFKTTVEVAWHTELPRLSTIVVGLLKGYEDQCTKIGTYMLNGYGHEGVAELEGGGGQMPFRVMSGFRELRMFSEDMPADEQLGILYLHNRLLLISGPSPGVVWASLDEVALSDGEPEEMVNKNIIRYTIISELAVGLPDRDNRENWGETPTLQAQWDAALELCKLNTRAYLEGLAIAEEVYKNE